MLRIFYTLVVYLVLPVVVGCEGGASGPDEGRDELRKFIAPPALSYPASALQQRLNAKCAAYFDIGDDGFTDNLRVECSDERFCEEAMKAFTRAQYNPEAVRQNNIETKGVRFPAEFRLEDGRYETGSDAELSACG